MPIPTNFSMVEVHISTSLPELMTADADAWSGNAGTPSAIRCFVTRPFSSFCSLWVSAKSLSWPSVFMPLSIPVFFTMTWPYEPAPWIIISPSLRSHAEEISFEIFIRFSEFILGVSLNLSVITEPPIFNIVRFILSLVYRNALPLDPDSAPCPDFPQVDLVDAWDVGYYRPHRHYGLALLVYDGDRCDAVLLHPVKHV